MGMAGSIGGGIRLIGRCAGMIGLGGKREDVLRLMASEVTSWIQGIACVWSRRNRGCVWIWFPLGGPCVKVLSVCMALVIYTELTGFIYSLSS